MSVRFDYFSRNVNENPSFWNCDLAIHIPRVFKSKANMKMFRRVKIGPVGLNWTITAVTRFIIAMEHTRRKVMKNRIRIGSHI